MRTESSPRGRWEPMAFTRASTSRHQNFNSCNKENIFSREKVQKVLSPQNRGEKLMGLQEEDTAASQRFKELTKRRDRLLREKVNYANLFAQLRKEKERLETTNQRLLEDEQLSRRRLHEMEREHLAQYRRNQREKEELLDKIQMLSQMESSSGTSRIGQVQAQLQKVKGLFLQQERVNTQRYNSLVKESEQLQLQNRRLKDYLQSRKKTVK